MSEWTIEKEILTLSEEKNIRSALISAKLLEIHDELVEIQEIENWRRGGAETYVYTFQLIYRVANPKKLIAKAMVAWQAALPAEQQARWQYKMNDFTALGLKVPQCFLSGKSLIIEEFIEHDIRSYYQQTELKEEFVSAVTEYGLIVINSGFAPVNIIGNLRTDGKQIYWIDFGTDLGDRGIKQSSMERSKKVLAREISNLTGQEHIIN